MERSDFKFEICANSVESCFAAQDGGADRVELCANIPEGGTTPSFGEIQQARKLLRRTALHVIIRPRGGNFTYSNLEAERMADDIDLCRNLGVDGVVFGCLDENSMVDVEICAALMRHCNGMSTTFHRAFDVCRDPLESAKKIAELGFDRILTSGGMPTAKEGAENLKALVNECEGKIGILVGSGVNEENISWLWKNTGAREFHFSARESVVTNALKGFGGLNGDAVDGGAKDWESSFGEIKRTSSKRVSETISALIEASKL